MLGLPGSWGLGVPWQPGMGKAKDNAFFSWEPSRFISSPCEPQVIALGTCELLWNYDASNPWLRTVDLWPEGIRQRTAVREWELSMGVGQNWTGRVYCDFFFSPQVRSIGAHLPG